MFGKGRSGAAGRGSGMRPLSTPVQLHRPGEASGARPPIGPSGQIRGRNEARSLANAVQGKEETFRLEPGELDFGAIIRLTPDILKEIKRLEAQGGAARIKFDANANNSAGNVVDVGGKEFSFTWSQELTDLCDIYEEHPKGDDGDGLLVECGAAWRKLNVQRILDESTKNRVKMRSEEAERISKSRKAIVLDPTNPSVKNQAKSMAAVSVEGNMRRMGWKHKNETLSKNEMLSKKRKVEGSHGAAALSQSKLVSNSATVSNSSYKSIPSPVPSPQQPRSHTLLSSSGTGKKPSGDNNIWPMTPQLNLNKEEIDIFVKEMPTGISGESMQDINVYEEENNDPPSDLQSMLINLLSQNPKGMSFTALEQALGDVASNSVMTMQNVLRNIATLQKSGKYLLKQGRQISSSTRSFEGESSPECSNMQTKKTTTVISEKTGEGLDEDAQISKIEEVSDLYKRIDIMQDNEDRIDMEEKARDNSVVRAGSSSESGSDTDSGSSSSGSDTGSQSRSKAGSGSASSSDSESDDSSSSKDASDVDVDIMTSDDEKGEAVQHMDATALKLSPLPRLWESNGELDINGTNKRDQRAHANSSTVDLPDFESNYERVNSTTSSKNCPNSRNDKSFEKIEAKTAESIGSYLHQSKSRSSVVFSDHNKVMENKKESPSGSLNNDRHRFAGTKYVNEEQTLTNDCSEQLDINETFTRTNTKQVFNSEHFMEKSENSKRMKISNLAETSSGKAKCARPSENSLSLTPERSMQMAQKVKMNNNHRRDERKEIKLLDENIPEHSRSSVVASSSRVLHSPDFTGPPNYFAEKSGQKLIDSSERKRTDLVKPIKYAESNGRANKHLETVSAPLESDISAQKNIQVDRISTVNGKHDENCDVLEKYCAKGAKEIMGEKMLSTPDLLNRKFTEGHTNAKGNILRRELSDLELGEFREPLIDFVREDRRPFDRKNTSKKIENNVTLPDSSVDMNIGKCDGIRVSESKKQSSPILQGGMNGNVLIDDILDLSRTQSKILKPQYLQSAKVDTTESEARIHLDRCAKSDAKNGTRTDQGMGVENKISGPKKSSSTRPSKEDNKRDVKNVIQYKTDKLNGLKRSTDQGTDDLTASNGVDSVKSLEFTSDEENAPYMKFEETELDLKGPIKDFSMYKDYVHEYQEKYGHYMSLNKKLEKIRNYFLKVGDDLELARGRDMEEYCNIVEKLRQLYHQRGERHKEMKRIYILLHEELKTIKDRIKDFAQAHSGV